MTVFKNLLTITSQRTAQNQHMKFTLLGPARNLKSHKYNIGRKIICQIKMLFIFQSKLICKHDFKKIRFFFKFSRATQINLLLLPQFKEICESIAATCTQCNKKLWNTCM